MALKFTVELLVEVDKDAAFLEFDSNEEVVLDLFKTLIYDLDDIKLKEIEVEDIT